MGFSTGTSVFFSVMSLFCWVFIASRFVVDHTKSNGMWWNFPLIYRSCWRALVMQHTSYPRSRWSINQMHIRQNNRWNQQSLSFGDPKLVAFRSAPSVTFPQLKWWTSQILLASCANTVERDILNSLQGLVRWRRGYRGQWSSGRESHNASFGQVWWQTGRWRIAVLY